MPEQVGGRSVGRNSAVITFRDHIRVDRPTVHSALLQLSRSPTSRIEIRWNDKINDVQSLIDSMLRRLDEKMTYFPWYRDPDSAPSTIARNIAVTKSSFFELVEEVDRVQAEVTSGLDRLLQLIQDVEHAHRLEAVSSFCTFGALRLVSYLQQFAGQLLDENNDAIVRVFNDLPRVSPGHWFRCVPYVSTTGLLAFGEGRFLRCRVGVSESDYRNLLLPTSIANLYQDNADYPLDVYYKWILPQWCLYVTDEVPLPPPNRWFITVLSDDVGREQYTKRSRAPWDSESSKDDMGDERHYSDGYEPHSGLVVRVGAVRTVLVRRQDPETASKAIVNEGGEVTSRLEPRLLKLFYSYSHADERLRNRLETHLATLQAHGVIEGWYDRKILPGTEWSGEISSHLNSADIILFLVSADFLASRYCRDVEVRRAVEKHRLEEARVILIILRDCDWRREEFRMLQALPTDGRAVTLWTNRDTAFRIVAQGIRAVAEELRSRPT